jgi:hypothetical protein
MVLREYQGPTCKYSLVKEDACCALGLVARRWHPQATTPSEIGTFAMLEISNLIKEVRSLGVDVVKLNDVDGMPFNMIADQIEAALEKRNDAT